MRDDCKYSVSIYQESLLGLDDRCQYKGCGSLGLASCAVKCVRSVQSMDRSELRSREAVAIRCGSGGRASADGESRTLLVLGRSPWEVGEQRVRFEWRYTLRGPEKEIWQIGFVDRGRLMSESRRCAGIC